MDFLTARKRATGLGSAKQGTRHAWEMKVQSVALVVLIPLFVFTVGPMLGASHLEVIARFSRPLPALIVALTFVVGFLHFRSGVQVLIEDYAGGMTRTALIIAMICVSYAAAAAGVFAVVRIAL